MSKCGVIAVASVALLVSRCSVVGGSSDANDGDAGAASSPLADFLGIGDLGNARSDDAQARLLDIQREINDSVAACMTAQGFEFVPPDLDEVTSFDSAGPDGIEYGTPEYTARYGFGVTTQRWPQSTVGPELVGYEDFSEVRVHRPQPGLPGGPHRGRADRLRRGPLRRRPDYEWDPSLTDDENQERAEAFYADYDASGCYAEAEQGEARSPTCRRSTRSSATSSSSSTTRSRRPPRHPTVGRDRAVHHRAGLRLRRSDQSLRALGTSTERDRSTTPLLAGERVRRRAKCARDGRRGQGPPCPAAGRGDRDRHGDRRVRRQPDRTDGALRIGEERARAAVPR
ncbi:MAG: hypothetical protein R2710_21520 [Acidimicrobiales bacterium]